MKTFKNILIIFVLSFCLQQVAAAGIFGGDQGKKKIEKILRTPAMSTVNTGIKAVCLTSGKTLVDINGGKLFVPASSVKLLTAYCALKTLTPQYVFPTEFLADTAIDSGTVHTLYIRGYGDPSVTLADINLQALDLSEKLSCINGDIVVDGSYFDGPQFGQGWMWDEGNVPWNAPISPYALNGNCIDIFVRAGAAPGSAALVRTVPATRYALIVASVTTVADRDTVAISREETPLGDRFIVTGGIAVSSGEKEWRCTVSRPGLYAGTLFAELLAHYGVSVKGCVSEGPTPSIASKIGRYESRPLGMLVRRFLKDSDNLYGECILRTLGAAAGTPPGNADKGVAAIGAVLKDLGIAPGSYRLVDGSGHSSYNLLSPSLITRLLQASYNEFTFFPEYMDALSVAGVDGTLKNRFKGSALARLVRAKTGSMSSVSCLSGYLKTRRGNLLAVSIMMNGFTGPSKPCLDAQDEIVKTLWENY